MAKMYFPDEDDFAFILDARGDYQKAAEAALNYVRDNPTHRSALALNDVVYPLHPHMTLPDFHKMCGYISQAKIYLACVDGTVAELMATLPDAGKENQQTEQQLLDMGNLALAAFKDDKNFQDSLAGRIAALETAIAQKNPGAVGGALLRLVQLPAGRHVIETIASRKLDEAMDFLFELSSKPEIAERFDTPMAGYVTVKPMTYQSSVRLWDFTAA